MEMRNFLKKKGWIFLVAVLVLAVGIITAITLLNGQNQEVLGEDDEIVTIPKERTRLKLDALLSDKTGIRTETGFKLTYPKGFKCDARIIKEALSVSPSFDFDLDKENDGLVIKPKSALQANQVYTFKLSVPEQNVKESWAFQTRREFKIISCLPGNQSTLVPVNTGIEITFSHTDILDFEKNFSIEPNVKGRFEMHKNIAVFIPQVLEPDTLYTVTIGKDVTQAQSGENIKEDYSFSFQTEGKLSLDKGNNSYLSFYDELYNFSSDAQPILEMSASEDKQNQPIQVSLYRYDVLDDFIKDYTDSTQWPRWAFWDKKSFSPSILAGIPFKSYNLTIAPSEVYYYSYLSLPENLPEGYYFLTLSHGECKDFTFIQINDTQLYVNIGEERSILWANDRVTCKPVEGAVFEGNGLKKVTTGADGTALINESFSKQNPGKITFYTLERAGHPALVAPIYNDSGDGYDLYNEDNNLTHWNSLYLDRSNYLPTDTIKAWGILRPRNGESPPEKVTVQLLSSTYDYRNYEYTHHVLKSKEVSLTRRGTFSVEFAYDSLPMGSYLIEVKKGDTTLSSSYLYINRYVKSQYVVSLEADNLALFSGETLAADVGCEFFEGTPVSGYEMNYYVRNFFNYENITQGQLALDQQGRGRVSLPLAEQTGPGSWVPQSHRLLVNNLNPEETEVSDQLYFYVFPRDVMVRVKTDFKNGSASILFKTHTIDLSTIRHSSDIYGEYGEDPLYTGSPISKTLKVTLYEHFWDRQETGEYYDSLSKKNVKTYDYFEVERELQTFTIDTINGLGSLNFDIPGYSEQKSYSIVYETTDNQGRPIKEDNWLYSYDGYWYGYGYENDHYYLDFEKEEARYKIGEDIVFGLKKNYYEPIEGGSVLYLLSQNGLKESWTSKESVQRLPFKKEYIPNIYLSAVYFDGRNIFTAYQRLVRYDYAEKGLEIAVNTDKESYRPGETVNCTLQVTDQEGNPCPADVNLSVVDEAYYALYGQDVDTLADLYRSVYPMGGLNTYISHREPYKPTGGAEGGEGEDEGGGSAVRKDFVDSAWFETVETDENGQAKLSFKLPDNLTTWRLTYQAFTEDIQAGSGKKTISTKLPFFLKTVVNDTLMEGDIPALLMKVYGEALDPNDEITYTVAWVTPHGLGSSVEGKGKAGDYTEITLPQLEEGLYTLTMKATCGKLTDTIEKKIQVNKSLLKAKKVDYYSLSPSTRIDDVDSYAMLSFYNGCLSDYYDALTHLYWSWGNRLDQIVARNVSAELLRTHFEEGWYSYGDKADISSYQKEDGGFALLPYGSSDVELSAKIAALCGQEVNTAGLITYFRRIVEDAETTPLQVSAAYWGLASLKEPVLLDLKAFMEEGSLTLDEKLYLGNALADLGDLGGAEDIYQSIARAHSKEVAPYRYIDEGGDKDDVLRWTSLMSMLAAKVDAQDKMAYFRYVESLHADETLMNLERLVLVKQGLPNVLQEASVTLEIGGRNETLKLKGAKPQTLMLSPEEVKSLKVSQIKGEVALSVTHEASGPAPETASQAVVERSYNEQNGILITLDRTGTVTVNLKVTFDALAPEGYYEITDVLPAGLRYLSYWQDYGEDWYFGQPDGQRVRLGCYYNGDNQIMDISYKARVYAPGTYRADSTMIKHSESDAYGLSKQTTVVIK